mmetsp:Transcript_94100/g.206091  ORF Transcript_94100/g.206091 Transcript_94100/m.206091 type:complete len:210 (-) Transcript_94100:58-687(-)
MTKGSLILVLELIHPSSLVEESALKATFIRRPSPISTTCSVVPTCNSASTSLSNVSSLLTVTIAIVSHISPGIRFTMFATCIVVFRLSLLELPPKLRLFLSTAAAAAEALEALEAKLTRERREDFVVRELTLAFSQMSSPSAVGSAEELASASAMVGVGIAAAMETYLSCQAKLPNTKEEEKDWRFLSEQDWPKNAKPLCGSLVSLAFN